MCCPAVDGLSGGPRDANKVAKVVILVARLLEVSWRAHEIARLAAAKRLHDHTGTRRGDQPTAPRENIEQGGAYLADAHVRTICKVLLPLAHILCEEDDPLVCDL